MRRVLPYALLLIFMLLVFHRLAFTDLILGRGDTFHYFYPYWDARNAALRAGELPLWTPHIYMGAPLLANPQLGTWYPPNWLTIPFNAPDAIRYSILLHILWAAIGAYALFRQTIAPRTIPALVAAVIYALGGYIGAHVEQINQLQGLAWMPFLFLLLHHLLQANRRRRVLWVVLLALAWAMQLFTGHTQTVFISGVGLGLYVLVWSLMALFTRTGADTPQQVMLRTGGGLLALLVVALAAAFIALPQLLPTMELSGLSNRGGGFNVQEATAFSLPPTYIGRALLPSYDGLLFGEYIAYSGIIGLGSMAWAILTPQTGAIRRVKWAWVILALVGVALAFGRFNPLYLLLAELPGFDFFRVPARWLALFALAAAMLAGMGVWHLQTSANGRAWRRIIIVAAMLTALMALTRFIFDVRPEDFAQLNQPTTAPTLITMLAWSVALAGLLLLFIGRNLPRLRSLPVGGVAMALIVLELWAASVIMPYNDLVPADVYTQPRFTTHYLQAVTHEQIAPKRLLSISGLFFDTGDKAALEARYRQWGLDPVLTMDENAIRHALVGIKKQEMLFPNLPLTWHVASVDGFGGGVLPTMNYSQFTSLFLPSGTLRTVDGRLGELLALPDCRGACIPAEKYLDMMGVGYLITDKVYDVWHEGIAYDTTYHQTLDTTLTLPNVNGFEGTHLHILHHALPNVMWQTQVNGGDAALPLEIVDTTPLNDTQAITVLQADSAIAPVSLAITPSQPIAVYGVTWVDARTGDFVQLTPDERILSSDIKMYKRPVQRAYLAQAITVLPDTWQGSEDALQIMAQDDFRVDASAVIHTDGDSRALGDAVITGDVTMRTYETTHIEMDVQSNAATYLILKDAHYPGWQATVNGQPAPIYRANVMFRAVAIPAGESTVIMTFAPPLVTAGMMGGVVALAIGVLVLLVVWRGQRQHAASA